MGNMKLIGKTCEKCQSYFTASPAYPFEICHNKSSVFYTVHAPKHTCWYFRAKNENKK